MNFRLETGLPGEPGEEVFQSRERACLRRRAQGLPAAQAACVGQTFLEADGLFAAKCPEVAGVRIILEARDRLSCRVDRGVALAARLLQVAEIIALDALILRVQFRHGQGPHRSHNSQWRPTGCLLQKLTSLVRALFPFWVVAVAAFLAAKIVSIGNAR